MPLAGEEVALERIGSDEWRVKFSVLAVRDRIWEFEVYRTTEAEPRRVNLFWSEERRDFVGDSRADVPAPVLERVVEWVLAIASVPT